MIRPTLVFDLDGTLVDTAPDLAAAGNHVLSRAGFAPIPLVQLRPFVGKGARRTVEAAFAAHGVTLTPDASSDHVAAFLEFYTANIAVESRPFPGLVDALEDLSDRGITLAVCTNKREHLAVRLLQTLGLSHFFAAVAGGDTFPVRKPEPGHLLSVIERVGGAPGRSIMVGDTDADIAAARSAGVPVIGVTFGYSETPIHDLAPDAVVTDFHQLSTVLNNVSELRRAIGDFL